jgi:Protein of unknown function (DUF1036)
VKFYLIRFLFFSSISLITLFIPARSQAETFFHKLSGSCIHPFGGSTNPADNTPLVFSRSDCQSGASKLQFRFLPSGSIQHISSGKCIHADGGNPNPIVDTPLVLHTGCDEQRLRFRVTANGSIQHVTSGKCIHPNGGASNPPDDTRLVLHNACNEERLAIQVNVSRGYQVCNQTSSDLSLAYVTSEMGSFGSIGTGASTKYTSRGWLQVKSGQCRIIHQGNAFDVAALLATGGGRAWPEVPNLNEFCVNPSPASFPRFIFTGNAHKSETECRSAGGGRLSFFREGVGTTSNFFTYTFR